MNKYNESASSGKNESADRIEKEIADTPVDFDKEPITKELEEIMYSPANMEKVLYENQLLKEKVEHLTYLLRTRELERYVRDLYELLGGVRGVHHANKDRPNEPFKNIKQYQSPKNNSY